ncbi:MAG: ChaN family lipoprotein [Planctomycetes bacterium]|nr:ChaN family lipoprotein [Planctomycetota bacterium]
MFTSDTGQPINWQDLLNAAAWADVIIIGEQHDDSVGHAVQLALVTDTIQRFPGTALSMEMLDREEQTLVDDYLAGIIKLDMFLEKTASTKWLRIARDYLSEEIDREKFEKRILRIGWPHWEEDYQPIIDAAKDNNARVIAANTPWIRYMSLASREGFDRLDSLTDAQKRLFAYPKQESYPGYRERFWQVMAGRAEGEVLPEPTESDETEDGDEEGGGVHPDLTDEQIKGAFRGQLTMDATMADSIVKALNSGSKKVVHLVGQFHSDFEGGTVQELRQRKHGIKILNISMQRAEVVALRDEDIGRADIIIYTPERVEEEDKEETVEAEEEVDAEEDTSDEEVDPHATQPTSQPATTKPIKKKDLKH